MAALVKVTDSISGEQIIINADRIQTIRRRDNKTVIEYDRDRVTCMETPTIIFNAVLAQRH